MTDYSFKKIMGLFENNYHLLLEGKWGIEKEALRVTQNGKIALTPHPEIFGDKLENPYITTDFSESQIEMITPPLDSIEDTYKFLDKIQSHVEKNIDNEILWTNSMPAGISDEEEIPIAKYNDTDEGIKNEIYRQGLALRYGKAMQLISGIHYNFSFKDVFWDYLYEKSSRQNSKQSYINDAYFRLARNYLRYRWILIYLFGASPVIDKSFTGDIQKYKKINKHKKYATSLRMSNLGYSSDKAKSNNFLFDNLTGYISELEKLLDKENKDFKNLGLFKDGKQIQLNYNILQKESEYYSPIRIKSDDGKKESHIERLKLKGVNYLEIRSIDLNPFYRLSVNLSQLYFMHVFMLYCLFEKNEFITENEMEYIKKNDNLVALNGRKKYLELYKLDDKKINLEKWGEEIFDKLIMIANLLDKNNNDKIFSKAVMYKKKKLGDKYLLPSEKIINEMKTKKQSFIEFSLKQHDKNKSRKYILILNPFKKHFQNKCCYQKCC